MLPGYIWTFQASLLGPHPLGSSHTSPSQISLFYRGLTSLLLIQIPMFSEISGFRCGLLAWFSLLGMAGLGKGCLRCLKMTAG